MEFMGFNMVDIGIIALALFLAIKGLVNGFSKELLSFLTLIGGIALASRFNTKAVEFINAQELIPAISSDYTKLIGFVAILIAVWIVMSVIGSVINKVTGEETGVISRIFGYLLSLARYGFIFSLIVFGIGNSDFFKEKASKYYEKSKLFMPMTNYGAWLLNIEPNQKLNFETNATQLIKQEDKKVIDINNSLFKKLTVPSEELNSSN